VSMAVREVLTNDRRRNGVSAAAAADPGSCCRCSNRESGCQPGKQGAGGRWQFRFGRFSKLDCTSCGSVKSVCDSAGKHSRAGRVGFRWYSGAIFRSRSFDCIRQNDCRRCCQLCSWDGCWCHNWRVNRAHRRPCQVGEYHRIYVSDDCGRFSPGVADLIRARSSGDVDAVSHIHRPTLRDRLRFYIYVSDVYAPMWNAFKQDEPSWTVTDWAMI